MTATRSCVTCGTTITVTTGSPNRRFCSPRFRPADLHARKRATTNGVANDVANDVATPFTPALT